MKLDEIRDLICEEERPENPTTYWVPVGMARDGLSEEEVGVYLSHLSTQYHEYCPCAWTYPSGTR